MGQLPRKVALPVTTESLHAFIETQNNILAHRISFGSTFISNPNDLDNNMECWKATGTTPVGADTEFFILHNLPRIPIFFIYFLDRAGDLYSYYVGMTAWTKATNAGLDGKIYLKCSVSAANYRVIIF